MKKVLVTGAAGAIGINVIKYLLSEGKYEITALDLRNKNNQRKLRKYRRRINIIYGDINDSVLVDALVKDQDYIIHLAGAMPPLADIKRDLSERVDYDGTENIIRAIDFYNPNCFLVFASSTTLYGNVDKASVKSQTKVLPIDYYSMTKIKIEELIKEKLKKYVIIRIPLLLTNPASRSFMYNVKRNSVVEAITDNDAAYLFVSAIDKAKELNKKTFNAGGGEVCTAKFREILANVLNIYGFSFRYLGILLFVDKNFYSHVYEDSDELEDILEFRSDSLDSFYMRLKREVRWRFIPRLFAKPFVWMLKKQPRKRKRK
ncbi:MAG: NAD(P)-dependent oxidoreductase [Bacilli bacterium]|nr:NAD(P)-dependent oxidoreductase [Bacilli bacterium]